MQALPPKVVIPGHMKAGTALNAETIRYSQHDLTDIKLAKQASSNRVELIDKMTSTQSDAGLAIALGIGAKVYKGEMKW
jgi:hypothetical protein